MKFTNSFIKRIYTPLTHLFHEGWAVFFPKSYAKYYYRKALNKNLNLNNPKDYNEKIQWLKIYSDISQWTELADKYKVRKYIEQCGLADKLVKLYGVWEKIEDIDFNLLPDKFVLKANNASGKVILVRNRDELNYNKTREILNKWLKERYGLISFEPHYWNIDRRIIAEELLDDHSNKVNTLSLIDYKFFCFHGEPLVINVIFERNNLTVGSNEKSTCLHFKENFFDLNWNFRTDILADPDAHDMSVIIPRPKCFDEMIEICRILSKPFPQVRVDLYEVNQKVYFGEMTFTPGGGMNDFSREYYLKMGELIDLSQVKRRRKCFII